MRAVAVAEKEAKAERIELRVSPAAKALLVAAADARHTTVSEFLLRHGVEAAEEALAIPSVFYATEAGWETVQAMLADEAGRTPSPETIAWLKKAPRLG